MGLLMTAAIPALSQGLVGAGPYYHFDLVAKIGTTLDTGEAVSNNFYPSDIGLEAIPDHFSMNDRGDILALYKVAKLSGAVLQYAVASYDPSPPSVITKGGTGVGGISDNGAIFLGNNIYAPGSIKSGPSGYIHEVILDSAGFFQRFLPPIVPFETVISRNGTMYFKGLDQRLISLAGEGYGYYRVLGGAAPAGTSRIYPLQVIPSISTTPIAFSAAGDNGRLVISEYRDGFHRLTVLDPSGTTRLVEAFPIENVSPAMGLFPAITGDGEFLAYAVAGQGGGDFIMVGQTGTGQPLSQPDVAFSTRKVIGLSATGNPIRMQSIPLTPISIIRHDKDDNGLIEGDVLWLTFLATPGEASVENPRAPGKPLLFRATEGVWSLRVDIQRDLDGNLQLNASGPMAVVQLGDTLEGREILELQLSQSLARGTKDSNGMARVPGRNDHVIGFRLRTSQGLALLRATHFDSDEDGLPNHWEKTGGGVDGDRDGVPDLVLSRFGADPLHKDLFLEMDWLPARTTGYPGGWDNRPSARSLFYLAEVFNAAPVGNPDGSPGIRLHIDAGSGTDAEGILLTNGLGTTTAADRQGGDEVRPRGIRPDVIHIGEGPSLTSSAFEVASMDEVKAGYFGSREKSAREYAFRYSVLGDFQNMTPDFPGGTGEVIYATVNGITGNTLTLALNLPVVESRLTRLLAQEWIGVASGPAAGQIRPWNKLLPTTLIFDGANKVIGIRLNYSGPVLSPRPATGDDLCFFSGSTGLAESFTRDLMDPDTGVRNVNRLGGNDLLLSMAQFATQSSEGLRQKQVGRTLAHELGHTLGLAHGGRDGRCSHRGDTHWSLMSYSHQLRLNGLDLIRTGGTDCGIPGTYVSPPVALSAQTTPPGLVNSFSNGLDPHGFNEWDYARLETWSVPWFLGNSRMRYAGALPPVHAEDEAGPMRFLDLTHFDVTAPVLTWQLPAAPVRSLPNSVLTVEFTATDNIGIASLSAAYDADGNGQAQGAGEVVMPAALGNNRYRADFTTMGPTGNRGVVIAAVDEAGNRSVLNPRLLVGAGPVPDPRPPYITPGQPQDGDLLPASGLVPIEFQCDDGSSVGGLLRAVVRFDVNGDGLIDPATEEFPSITAQSTQAGARIAWLPAVTGAAGRRSLQFIAEDRWFNRATLNLNVTVQPQDLAAPVLVWVTGPADGSAVDHGPLSSPMQVTATDSGGVKQLSWVLDANGDGAIEQVFSGERIRYFQSGTANSVTQAMILETILSGPTGVRTLSVTATDNAGNVASLSRTLVLTDQTAPAIRVTTPGSGDPIRFSTPLVVTGTALDNNRVLLLRATCDLDGDGTLEANEAATATPAGTTGAFTISFPALTGPAGTRSLNVVATDPSLNQSSTVIPLTLNPGGMLVFNPQGGDRWPAGSSAVASVELTSSAAPDRTVRFIFDVNGDGDFTDPGEEQQAQVTSAAHAPLPRAVAVFGSLSGPSGNRVLTAQETLDGSSPSSSDVLVEALPVSGISYRIAHIPATAPLTAAEGDGDSIPTPLARLGNIVFFSAQTPREGIELWRTDGTAQGTYLLRDIDPGFSEGLNPTPSGSDPDGFTVFGGRVFFAASEQGAQTFSPTIGSGRELWSSDGTVAGTSLFKDINPGRVPANPSDSSDPKALTVFQNRLWFMANDGTNGKRWWTSDGTAAGTERWPNSPLLNPGTEANPAALVIGMVMFFTNNGGSELWRTDGTAAGTTRIYVRGNPPFLAVFSRMIAGGPKLYLTGWTGSRYDLWTSDGTAAGTVLLRSLAGASSTLGIPDMAPLDSRVVFAAESTTEGREAWISDGTVAGTQLLRDLWLGAANSSGIVPSGFPRGFASLGDRVVFSGLSPTAGEEPWITDGTTAGTRVLADLTTTAWTSLLSRVPPGSAPDNFIADNSQVWWVAGDDGRRLGRELWRWDRNHEPYCVRDLMPLAVNRTLGGPYPVYNGPGNGSPLRLFGAGSSLFFRAAEPIYGNELFVSDGSSGGTRRLRNLSAGSATPASLTRANEMIVAGFDGMNARLLATGTGGMRSWRTEHGRAHGAPQNLVESANGIGFRHPVRSAQNTITQQVFRWADAAPAPLPVMSFSTIWRMAAHGPWIWIAGIETDGTRSLWRTDGTITERITTLMGGNLATLSLQDFLPDGSRVFFTAGVTQDRELWISDAAGTRRIVPAAGAAPTQAGGLIRFGGKCYFAALQGSGFLKIWSSDGTTAGTAPIRDGTLSADWSLPEQRPVVSNGRLLFSAIPLIDPLPPTDTLWSTDGTTAGTVELRTASNPGPSPYTSQEPRRLTVAGNRVFFAAITREFSGLGEELWFTDGTPFGTRFVYNIQNRPLGGIVDPGSDPRLLTAIGDNVIFTAGTFTEGRELWFSDGTPAGTRLVRAIRPGVDSPVIDSLREFDGRVYFAAHTAESGRELWYSDGTTDGTRPAEDLFPGPASADPRLLGVAGGRLHFLAHDGGDDRALRTLGGPPSAYTAWLGTFGRPEGFNSLPTADGDGDSWPNEWENWFGTSPVDPGHAPGLTFTGSQPSPGGGSLLTIQYRRPANWRDRNLVFEFVGGTNLTQWSLLETTEQLIEPGGEYERVTARIRVGATAVPRSFARLRVTKSP